MINLVNDLLSPFQKSTGAESPPILTEFGGETNAAGELPDENERNMPSLRIEEPGSPFLPDSTEMCKSVEECVRDICRESACLHSKLREEREREVGVENVQE